MYKQGLLDTSVVIDLHRIEANRLPQNFSVSVITMTELAAGPLAARDVHERARRQDVLQRIESLIDPIPFDIACLRAFGRVFAAAMKDERKRTRARTNDLLLAATACALNIPLFTRNADDFLDLTSAIDVVAIPHHT